MGFQVYIDESGDEGFQFKEDRTGSSEWFVLSAAVTRSDSDLATVKLVDAVRAELNKDPRSDLHFRKLNHHQRLPYLRAIGAARLRAVSVLVHKPSLEGDLYSAKGLLYRYATRLLLERVSWLCRDNRKDPTHAAKLIFSNRANMSFEELRGYLTDIRARTDQLRVRIDWTAVDCDSLRVEAHKKLMGLQIADAIASAMFFSVNRNAHGFTEPRYAEMIKPITYAHRGSIFGYGLKFMPAEYVRNQTPPAGLEWLNGGRW